MASRDLDEAERYAAAALFTLALHIIQVSVRISCSREKAASHETGKRETDE